jgi:hypothetical protein
MAKFATMKQLIHKAFSTVLAILVLASTLSLTVDKHFCADQLVDIAVLSKAKSCCASSAAENSSETEDSGCCKNETEVLIGQDELNLAEKQDLSFETTLFIKLFETSYAPIALLNWDYEPAFDDYAPPKISKDIYLLHEVYLI